MIQAPQLAPDQIVLAHMSKEEVEELSRAQGGVEYNYLLGEDHPLPQFFKLGEMLKNPQIRKAIQVAVEGYKQTPLEERPAVEQELDNWQDQNLGPRPQIVNSSSNVDDLVGKIAQYGTNGDDMIVVLPKKLAEFLWEVGGDISINETTGLPQFGFWSSILSVLGAGVGGLAGTFLFPGLGTAWGAGIGAGLGNLAGSYKDPETKDKNFTERLPGAALSGLLGGLGGSALSGGLASYAAAPIGGGLAAGLKGAGAAGLSAAKSLMLPFGAAALWKGSQDDATMKQEQKKEYEEQKKAYEEKTHKAHKELEDSFGFKQPLFSKDSTSVKRYVYTGDPMKKGVSHFIYTRPEDDAPSGDYKQYKKGGDVYGPKNKVRSIPPIMQSQYIDGHENGQEDNIYVQSPQGSFVFDASIVADLGDGSSKGGAKKLKEYAKKLPSAPINLKNIPLVDCAFSVGEFVYTPDKVAAIGHGSQEKGHRVLKSFVKAVRKHKAKNGTSTIPPQARSLESYLLEVYNKEK